MIASTNFIFQTAELHLNISSITFICGKIGMIKSNGYIMLQLHFLLFSKITLEKSSYVSWYHSWLRRKHKVDDIMLCIFTRPIYPNIHMHGKGHYFSCSYANKTRRRHNRKLLTKYAFPKKAHSIRFYHTVIKVSSVFGTRAYQEG